MLPRNPLLEYTAPFPSTYSRGLKPGLVELQLMHKVSGEREMKDEDFLSKSWFGDNSLIKSKAIGFVLIFIGAFVLINRMIIPTLQRYFDFDLNYNFQTLIVALLFILGGIKLITSNKKDIIESKEENA